jgi:hypothetical protein
MEYGQQLSELRRLILIKSSIRFITPADCKRISIEISKHLNKNVSETTIKRLFGFAVVKHKFSNFTLTTLAEYVDPENFQQVLVPAVRPEKQSEWESIKEMAEKITHFTLKTIRNRSGIPYDMTISRRFAEHDFDDFYAGDYIFTSLISQPGYGRTTLLSHLAENLFYKPGAPYKDSTLLFVKAANFFNLDQLNLNLEDQLKSQLNAVMNENILEYISKNQAKQGGKFIIVLDDFAELMLKKEQKSQVYDSIINLICSLEGTKNIKLMMSMRSTTWVRFFDRMRHSSFLKSKWFAGNYFSLHELSNVPPLSEKEVDMIISKINYLDNKAINPRLKAQLKFPFHIQLYYQLKEEDPDFNYYSNITFYELVSRFIQEKIYRSNYYTEKILVLKKIIQLTDYGKNANSVMKDSLIAELFAFKNAYMELLADGILMEEKRLENEHPKEYVRFLHTHTFEYFLFVEILEKFHLQVNMEFFTYINTQYEANQVRFQLLQWTIRFLIKTGNFNALKSVFKLDLINFEINYLILFIAEEIKYRTKYNHDMIRFLDEHKFHDIIINQLINFDFMDTCYKEAVIALLDISHHEEHLLTYNAILGLLDILSLNKEAIRERVKKMAVLSATGWMINPAEALRVIHARMNSLPVSQSGLMDQIDTFKKGENSFGIKAEAALNTKQAISYLLVIFTDKFANESQGNANVYQGTIQLINTMAKFQSRLFLSRAPFTIYMLNLYGKSCSSINPGKTADQLEKIIIHFSRKHNNNFTKYQETILRVFQAQQALNRKEYEIAADHARECLFLFKRNNMILKAIMVCNLLIQLYLELKNQQMVNEFKYEKFCMLDDHEIARDIL